MKSYIYYPTIEIDNELFLKFSLLFMEKLCPIFPGSRYEFEKDLTRKIADQSDLLSMLRLEYEEGEAATLDAIDKLDTVLRNPKAYAHYFRGRNFLEQWRDRDSQDYLLYEGKYTDGLSHFIEDNDLGFRGHGGLRINPMVGNIYMTLLSHIVGDNRDTSPLTDESKWDDFSMFCRVNNQNHSDNDFVTFSKKVINVEVPKNLNQISIDDVLTLRSDDDFRKTISAFNSEIERYIEQSGDKADPYSFKYELRTLYDALVDPILSLGAGAVALPLSVWWAIKEPVTGAYVIDKSCKQINDGIVCAKKTWGNIQNKRVCNKYLASLSKLG